MDRAESILQIKKACANIAAEMMKIQPALPALNDPAAQADLIKLVFQLTKDLEAIKKKVAAVERGEDNALV